MITRKKYLVLAAAALLAVSHVSQAQSGAPVIGAVNSVINEEGNNRDFKIAGNHNEIHIHGDCKSISVTGAQNKIYLDRVGQINITGAQNRVFYKAGLAGAEPGIIGAGVQNRISKMEGEAPPSKSPEQKNNSADPSVPARTPDANAPSFSGSTGQNVEFTGDLQVVNQAIDAATVNVTGDSNSIKLTGKANELVITGDSNSVTIDQVQKVHFIGESNKVTYRNPPDGKPPQISQEGENNAVSKASN